MTRSSAILGLYFLIVISPLLAHSTLSDLNESSTVPQDSEFKSSIESRDTLIEYPSTDKQVAYSSVVKLPFRPADVTHAYGSSPYQFGKLWLPNNHNNKNRLVVLIHGGCWLNAFDMKHAYPMATALSQAGYAVWAVEYRRTGDEGGGWPGSFEDVVNGIDAIDALTALQSYRDDVVLVGHSAGGHLALLATHHMHQRQPKRSVSVIGLAAITDLKVYSEGNNSCETATPQFMKGSFADKKSDYLKATIINKSLPKSTVLLQGDADNIVHFSHALTGIGQEKVMSGVGHFDWIHPGSDAFSELLKALKKAE